MSAGKRASVLAAKGAVDIVLKKIVNASHENPPNEEVILLGHVLLTKIGPKGKLLVNQVQKSKPTLQVWEAPLQPFTVYSCSRIDHFQDVQLLLKRMKKSYLWKIPIIHLHLWYFSTRASWKLSMCPNSNNPPPTAAFPHPTPARMAFHTMSLLTDRKFCMKARLTGSIHVTMTMIRNNTTNFRVLQSTLLVMKQYTANGKSWCSVSFTSLYLWMDGWTDRQTANTHG